VKTVKTFRSQDRRYFNVSLQTGSPRGVWNDAECTVGSSIYLTGVIGESGWYTLSNFCFIKMGNRLDIFSHNCYRYINLKSRLYLNNQAPRPNGEGDINLNISRALIVFVYIPSILVLYPALSPLGRACAAKGQRRTKGDPGSLVDTSILIVLD
jgi:hypothetical protein